ncbi:MAG: hypothetical protein OEM97_09360 [Acidimicrobiia bacterium]|nr:hypothetical protein [Acidimicrobiia bacterium]
MARRDENDFDEAPHAAPPKVIERAIERRLSPIPGVRKVRTKVAGGEAKVKVVARQGEHADELHDLVDDALGLDFWIDLGMPDMTYSVIIEGAKPRRS